jgi:hypothetical protein
MAYTISVPKKLGERKRVRAVCSCGRRYWTMRELHYSEVPNYYSDNSGFWVSETECMCNVCWHIYNNGMGTNGNS